MKHPILPLPITRRAALLGLGAALTSPAWAQDEPLASEAIAGTRIRFASVERGRALLMQDDEWMAATSDFQRRAVMNSAVPVTLDGFRRWNGEAVQPWTAAQRARWSEALARIAPGMAALRIPLPREVWLVASNGQESAGAPYTRGNAVVLTGRSGPPGYDAMLMAHELWHVAARHAPPLASRLYAEIGFEPMAELSFPAAWAPVRIANPDAPGNRHAMRLPLPGRTAWVTPVLVAARTALQPGESFFSVTDVRLLEVEPGAGGAATQAVLRNGEPAWHPARSTPEYLKQLGGNTGYVIHYEEAMADNVALLATGVPPRNPELLARIKAALERAA